MHSIIKQILFPTIHKGELQYKNNSRKRTWNRGIAFTLPIALCLSAILISCSDKKEEPDNNQLMPGGTTDHFYISFNLALPSTGTRSTTTDGGGSSDGTLNGMDIENRIDNASLYFFDAITGNKIFDFSTYEPGTLIKTETAPYKLTQEIPLEDFKKIFGKKINVYVLANIASFTIGNDNSKTEEQNFVNGTYTMTEFGSQNSYSRLFYMGNQGMLCPMANYDKFEIDLSNVTIDPDATNGEVWQKAQNTLINDSYASNNDLWNVTEYIKTKTSNSSDGTLPLERMIARVDMKDSSEKNNELFLLDGYTMEIIKTEVDPTTSQPRQYIEKVPVYLQIYKTQLFNVNKSFYLFRHTAAGSNKEVTGDVLPFGYENNASNTTIFPSGESENGKYNWIADCTLETKKTVEWAEGEDANILPSSASLSFWNQPEIQNQLWTIPGNVSQTNYSTFRDWIGRASSTDLAATQGYAPWFYVTENTHPTTSKMSLPFATGIEYKVLVCKSNDQSATNKVDINEVPDGVLRITRTSDGYYQEPIYLVNENSGFYLSYKYLIRHNTADTSNVDGGHGGIQNGNENPMGIGIVRNNVYQLTVTGFKNLPDPHEPDEYYMTVETRVLSWARVNNDNVSLGK